MQAIRRVVTGHDADGKAVFASDEIVAADGTFHQMWGGDETPTFPDSGRQPAQGPFFPAVGGYRFMLVAIPPSGSGERPQGNLDEAAAAEMEKRFPGLASHMEPDNPGMHTTDTIDFEYVLSGDLVLELDDGAEVALHAGDTVIQNGTRHRWHNRTTEPAVFVAFMIGAHRRS
jgi:mannose-6-phosphate isomerase-like protein (cupin superfamily)